MYVFVSAIITFITCFEEYRPKLTLSVYAIEFIYVIIVIETFTNIKCNIEIM